jgi:hypothetical protein
MLDDKTKKSIETNFIALIDTERRAKEGFENNNMESNNYVIPNDIFTKFYFSSLGALGIFILYNLMKKTKMIPR